MNICIFGDSIGKGVAFDEICGRYKPLKFNQMEPLISNPDINIKNYSVFGSTIDKGLSAVERYEEELSDYDYIITQFGGNDCNFAWDMISEDPHFGHEPKTPIEFFINSYKNIIEKIKKAKVTPILLTLPPLHAKRFFNFISKGLNKKNILKFLGGVDMIYRWQELYSLEIMKIGKALNIPVVDIRSEFIKRRDMGKLLGNDGMHPKQKGYELIVKTVYNQLV